MTKKTFVKSAYDDEILVHAEMITKSVKGNGHDFNYTKNKTVTHLIRKDKSTQ